MQGKNLTSVGYVNFPLHDKRYLDTGEGGMFVHLVVLSDDAYPLGVGIRYPSGEFSYLYNETLVGSDILGDSVATECILFPRLLFHRKDDMNSIYERYLSAGVLCVLTLGATNWSGFDEQRGAYFVASYDDLTTEGKALYEAIRALYPNNAIYLITWLDT